MSNFKKYDEFIDSDNISEGTKYFGTKLSSYNEEEGIVPDKLIKSISEFTINQKYCWIDGGMNEWMGDMIYCGEVDMSGKAKNGRTIKNSQHAFVFAEDEEFCITFDDYSLLMELSGGSKQWATQKNI